MRRVVMGPVRKTNARTTPQRVTRLASVETSRQTASPAAGESQLAQRTSNAATAITDTITTVRGRSAVVFAPETSIREMRASPRSLPNTPTGTSAGTTIMAIRAARKIDRPRSSAQKLDGAGPISRGIALAAPHCGRRPPARRAASPSRNAKKSRTRDRQEIEHERHDRVHRDQLHTLVPVRAPVPRDHHADQDAQEQGPDLRPAEGQHERGGRDRIARHDQERRDEQGD